MDTLIVPKGDYGKVLTFTINDAAGAAFNLTGYTITFKMWKDGNPGTLKVSGSGSILVAASGTCTYTPVAADFDTVGNYLAVIQLTTGSVQVSTVKFAVEVVENG